MKLKKFLEKCEKDEIIYLGTDNGGGWIDICTASELILKLDEVNKEQKDKANKSLQQAIKAVELGPERILYHREELKNASSDKEKKVLEGAVFRAEHRFATAFYSRAKYSKIIDGWKDIKERAVVETYNHETDGGGTCVIIRGHEKGDYWFQSEI